MSHPVAKPHSNAELELGVYTRNQSRVYPLPASGIVGIGRGAENVIRVEDPAVSRRHARIVVGEEVEVEDLGGTNGTILIRSGDASVARGDTQSNFQRRLEPSKPVRMFAGDVVRVGAVLIVLQRRHVSEPPQSEPEPELAGPPVLADAATQKAYDLAFRAAGSEISVLILGETGVGKEVMAETIHRRSRRASGPFLRLNCAAFSENLLEGEIFGHERGAFTGAHGARPGLFEATNGGTVFLDEVGELPLGTQAKMLRVLEERTVLRLGSTTPRRIDVRFITATNRDLGREVKAGRFRSDLYYRIGGMVVRIPPLRERPAEIEPLARHFLRSFAQVSGQQPPVLSEDAKRVLAQHTWPGNVRELRNTMERAALLAVDGIIDAEHLEAERPLTEDEMPADFDDVEMVTQVISHDAVAGAPEGASERERVLKALESCAGNQTRAAKLLGVSRRTLINRLEQFNLPRPKKQ